MTTPRGQERFTKQLIEPTMRFVYFCFFLLDGLLVLVKSFKVEVCYKGLKLAKDSFGCPKDNNSRSLIKEATSIGSKGLAWCVGACNTGTRRSNWRTFCTAWRQPGENHPRQAGNRTLAVAVRARNPKHVTTWEVFLYISGQTDNITLFDLLRADLNI